jgi:hypothetical protein
VFPTVRIGFVSNSFIPEVDFSFFPTLEFSIMEQLEPYLIKIDQHFGSNKALSTIRSITKIRPVFIVSGIYLVFSISIFFGIIAGFSTDCLIYFYASKQALRGYATNNVEELKKWAVYFVFWGVFNVFKGLVDFIPYYFVFKSLLAIWMYDKGLNTILEVNDSTIRFLFSDQTIIPKKL